MEWSTDVATAVLNRKMKLRFKALPNPSARDYFCFVPEGVKVDASNYGHYIYTKAAVDGEVDFTVYARAESSKPMGKLLGKTDIVLLDDDSYNEVGRFPGPVMGDYQPAVSLGVDRPAMKFKESITLSFTNPTPTNGCEDFVAIIPTGQPIAWLGNGGSGTSQPTMGHWRSTKYATSESVVLSPSSGFFKAGKCDLVYGGWARPGMSVLQEWARVVGALTIG